jgi:hypothetical protein
MGEYDEPRRRPLNASPTGRRGNLFSGLKDHVSSAASSHLLPKATDLGRQAMDTATGLAANNPDTVERIGGAAGAAVGASLGGAVGAKVGQKAGKKLGGVLSKKAKEKTAPPPSSGASAPRPDRPNRFS